MTRPLIVLTNDDGITSPGLWAVALAVEALGDVLVAAPRVQQTGAGRSMPNTSLGHMDEREVTLWGRTFRGYAVDGAPAQVVQHALLELVPRPPALVIAGINYGENVGSGVTVSGTVGAALEAATFGVPSLAISLQTPKQYHFDPTAPLDFSAAAHFAQLFARKLMALPAQSDVDVLKVEVPSDATPHTPWRIARLSRQRYFLPVKPARRAFHENGPIDYRVTLDEATLEADSDVAVLVQQHLVAVTPLSLDLTARVDLKELERILAGIG